MTEKLRFKTGELVRWLGEVYLIDLDSEPEEILLSHITGWEPRAGYSKNCFSQYKKSINQGEGVDWRIDVLNSPFFEAYGSYPMADFQERYSFKITRNDSLEVDIKSKILILKIKDRVTHYVDKNMRLVTGYTENILRDYPYARNEDITSEMKKDEEELKGHLL